MRIKILNAAVACIGTTLAAWTSCALAIDPFVVRDIRVEGIQRTDAGTVFSYLPVKVGDTVNDEKASAAIKEEFAFCLEARKFTLNLLKPGTPCKEIWNQYNAFMKKNKRPEEARLYCHGQGYDLVERPLIRNDEPLPIEVDTNIVVHPTYVHRGIMSWVCDNWLIGKDGPGERIHKFPEMIVELG